MVTGGSDGVKFQVQGTSGIYNVVHLYMYQYFIIIQAFREMTPPPPQETLTSVNIYINEISQIYHRIHISRSMWDRP